MLGKGRASQVAPQATAKVDARKRKDGIPRTAVLHRLQVASLRHVSLSLEEENTDL